MTDTPTDTWPNPNAPGVPVNAAEPGVHWLWRQSDGWVLHRWQPDERQYYGGGDVFGPDWAARRWSYGGAVLTPADVAAREAAAFQRGAEAMREKAESAAWNLRTNFRKDGMIAEAVAIGEAGLTIRALPIPEHKP